MIIVDEVSLISQSIIKALDTNLKVLCSDKHELSRQNVFGGLHIIFAGEFRQLEPVASNSTPLYHNLTNNIWIDNINCYIKLNGTYQFLNDTK